MPVVPRYWTWAKCVDTINKHINKPLNSIIRTYNVQERSITFKNVQERSNNVQKKKFSVTGIVF